LAEAVLRPLRRAPPAMSTRDVDQCLLRFFVLAAGAAARVDVLPDGDLRDRVGVSLRRSATSLLF
jgi:hypothetical protein